MHNHQAFAVGHLVAVVVAAGSGSRFGGAEPKQFQRLGGKPLVLWSIEALLQCSEFGSVVVVAAADEVSRMRGILPKDPRVSVVAGGATRTDSVRAGLAALAGGAPDKVLIHDAARPGLSVEVIRELAEALETSDAAAPALPLADAVKERIDTGELRSIDRERLVRVQTPQAFRFRVIYAALRMAKGPAVDDLALVEAAGASVVLTRGRTELMKVTHPEDMAIVEKLITGPIMRVGTGFDVHGFEPGDDVLICGVKIPHDRKLEGHSDADVGWHALTDAILGAAALGDIGDHFPPSDPKWQGAASIIFLQHAAKLAADRGFRIVNADITLLCEKPKIKPHREAMRASTAVALGLPLDAVSVKATTTEKLGFLGREEGIAAQAVVLLAG
jgi:2-C-methyl-D-erythritol 4-phosphate cytidylyltransferase / 2-C-methyl-D-erythritol 2,4-cyclodiphosphate synthase